MSTITLKNVPSELHRRLKARADQNRRSLNREAIRLLEQAVAALDESAPDHAYATAIAFRERLAAQGVRVTARDVKAAIEEGRV